MPALIANRFCLIEKIGHGTFADLWRAEDLHTPGKCAVALKIFRADSPLDRNRRCQALLSEVEAGLRMRPHPNVRRGWAVVRADIDGQPPSVCLVMDYVDGLNLALWLERQDPPAPGTIEPRLAVLDHLLRGIAHAHASGVVHGDISFGNVLVRQTPDTGAVLIDFGSCQLNDGPIGDNACDPEPSLQPLRPPPYSVHTSLASAARRDVYAFATLGCLTLAGRHPLTDDWQTLRTGLWRGVPDPHRNMPRRPLLDLAPWMRTDPRLRALSQLLASCLHFESPHGPPTAVELLREWSAIMNRPFAPSPGGNAPQPSPPGTQSDPSEI